MLTDFLQNTYVPVEEMLSIDKSYFQTPHTTLIPKDFKPAESVKKLQIIQARKPGEEQPMHDHRNLPRIKRPLSDFAESAYQIQMILHPIHVIMMTIRKGKSVATSEES
jgi:hypothetical protein